MSRKRSIGASKVPLPLSDFGLGRAHTRRDQKHQRPRALETNSIVRLLAPGRRARETNSLVRPFSARDRLASETESTVRPKTQETNNNRDQQFQNNNPTATHYHNHQMQKQQNNKQHKPNTQCSTTRANRPQRPTAFIPFSSRDHLTRDRTY